jgi:simple sugar transport system permease protein
MGRMSNEYTDLPENVPANSGENGSREMKKDPIAPRRIGLGIALLVVAAIMLLVFATDAPASVKTTFQLNARPAIQIPNIHLSVLATIIVLGIITAILGVVQILWKENKHTYLLFGIGLVLFGIGFLAWAGKGVSVDVEGLLMAMLIQAVPLTLGALSGLLCERAGVITLP